MGGLGLRSASRGAQPAYWAALVDELHVMSVKAPTWARRIREQLDAPENSTPTCLREASQAREALEREGMVSVPSWTAAEAGARSPLPPPNHSNEPGEWSHGWQFYACRACDISFKRHVLKPTLSRCLRSRLNSQSGAQAGRVLSALPTSRATEIRPERFQIILRRRLWLTLPLAPRRCPGRTCQAALDRFGHHLAACPRTGLLKRRSVPTGIGSDFQGSRGQSCRQPVLEGHVFAWSGAH